MSVYYVRSPASGMVKIGFATDARARFSKIQTDTPEKLILAAIEEGGKDVENDRHVDFASLRVRGEWFRYEGALARHVDSLPRIPERPRKIAGSGPLGAWLARQGLTTGEFADIVGTTSATISRICNGIHFPRRDLMLAIVEATNWEVDANALFGLSRPVEMSAAA